MVAEPDEEGGEREVPDQLVEKGRVEGGEALIAGGPVGRRDLQRPGLEHPLTVRKLAEPEINVVVNGGLALALIRRSGLRREEDAWVSPDGQRTTAIAEAVLWALLRIAAGEAR